MKQSANIQKGNEMENKLTSPALIDQLFDAFKPDTRLFRLDAIHLAQPLKTSKETKRRIVEGDFVLVENGKLKDCEGKPSHMITALRGQLNDTNLEISVIDCKSLELSIVKL